MNNFVSPYQAPRAPATSARTIVRYVAIALATVLVAGVLAVGCLGLLANKILTSAEKDMSPAVERYFSAVAAGDYHDAYADFGPAMRASTTEDDYAALDRGIHERLGQLQSKTLVQAQSGTGTGGSWADVLYSCHFERGEGSVRFHLQKDGGAWKIVGFRYDSPVLAEAFRSAAKSE
jgi:hypothetical protein